ncbi:MAG: porin [Gammaproteobacteria bacterium]
MNKTLIALAVSAGLAMPGLASAVEVAGKALQVYGQVHVSVDSATTHDSTGASVSKLNVSSNSSRLGFKGEGALNGGLTGFYKIEGKIKAADASGSSIDGRAAYVGLKGTGGSLMLGFRDTIYKDTFKMFDVMGNSVGDSRNILGAVSNGDGDIFDTRSKNGIYYYSPKMGGFKLGLGYSTAFKGDSIASQNNNNNSLTDAVLAYSANGLSLAAGYEQQKIIGASSTNNESTQTITGTRLVGGYKTGPMDIRLVYEHITNSGVDQVAADNRNAYGAAFVYKVGGPGSVILQYMKAATSDAGNDGANQVTVGYAYKLAKNAKAYIMYDKVSNDPNANFNIKAGHDLGYKNSVAGKDVSAISIGYVYKF